MYNVIKRAIDIIVSILALLLFSPLLLIVAIILKLTEEGEIIYRQKRIGLNARNFDLLKFVTMRRNSEDHGSITYQNDPRILPFGRILRDTKINELLQLINVLKGEMTLVGPRPLVDETGFQYYPMEIRENIYRDNKPGLTGIGSLFFRDEEEMLLKDSKAIDTVYKTEIMPVKGALELWYREKKNLWIDLKIVMLTAISIVFPKNKIYINSFTSINQGIIDKYLKLRLGK